MVHLKNNLSNIQKKLSKQSIFSEYRLPFFMFLRVSLFHMQLTFSLIYKNADYMENYKSLVCDVANITRRLKPEIILDSLWRQEMAAFYLHRKATSAPRIPMYIPYIVMVLFYLSIKL